ncbi:2-oxoglutarate dehydrogenase complex dihydrolipoyllysine-residue succinyltransferase [Parasutterella excrementihominis]|uniref:2-oxoglutarate dehydrogenase complex dihydrolipoyllysine-residue succinyltransferase n=1 Tax=Parasutterella excrementihominis TaxID=487175 RepID=UPI0027B8E625|nr:2-oxoglutarate dehydrogenase complex dihydrolipoyllysine-residue succinyltransferase [Parasutterella excrementihominis]
MSIVEVKVPELSESVSEASLIEWKKKVGEPVKADEILIEIETDKIVLEIPAPADGVLASIEQPDGAAVLSDQLIATIDTEGVAAAQPEAPRAAVAEEVIISTSAAALAPAPAPAAPAADVSTAGAFMMPSAEKLMANSGLSAAQVAGTGVGGRITKPDVIAALKSAQPVAPSAVAAAPAQPAAPKSAPAKQATPVASLDGRPEQRVPMSRLRARVAERLVESQSNCAILTTFNEVNLAPVMALRAKYKESFEKKYGVKLGFMSFFVKAAVHALKQYPIINASVDGHDIIYHGYMDIGIAVGSPRGLVVPILRDADQMTFAEIELKIADFAKRAKDGKLTLEELTGGTFTISNGGVFGSLFSTPIINPPQSAILGIHATKPRPVAENGEVVIRPMNYFAMSYDHRIIDGREAVLALVAMKEALEDPARLLLDL